MPDFLPAAEVVAKGVKHIASYVADAITERRNGFNDDEAGDYLRCAGADALAETFPNPATVVPPAVADDPAAEIPPDSAAGSPLVDAVNSLFAYALAANGITAAQLRAAADLIDPPQ